MIFIIWKLRKLRYYLARQNCEKLYLDSKTADVKFVFKDSDATVPALKAILSVGSPVFDIMFYGSLPEEDDILIEDDSPEAFKEFLQLFYLDDFQPTSKNIFKVANMCKKYELADSLKLCKAPMRNSLTIHSMCYGYGVDLLLEMENIIKYCEQEIKENASEILKSADFLECTHQLFDKNLRLVLPECSASDVVDASMAQTKAKCERDNLEATSDNLKAQLNSSFDRIPFAELDSEQFLRHTKTYKRFFVEDELEAIIFKKARKNGTTSSSRVLECNRRNSTVVAVLTQIKNSLDTSFVSNTKLQLTEINATVINKPCTATITLHNNYSGKSMNLGTILLRAGGDMRFVLPFPVIIDPDIKYSIKLNVNGQFYCR